MPKKKNPHYDSAKPHHTPDGFRNPDPLVVRAGDFSRWRAERRAQRLPRPPAEGYAAFCQRCWQAPDFSGTDDAVWWLGHASVLLRLNGRYVLTDPALSDRASPVQFAGPKRRLPPAARVDTLPGVDVVLISHNHYDHLDAPSIARLRRRFPQAQYLVPLGLGPWMRARGLKNVREMDWWDSASVDGLDVHFVPAQHWSKRTLWDTNRSLWGGWVVTRPGLRFYFAGDTGYTPHLAEIGERLGPFDLAALPIGAYQPRWFMEAQHVDPPQSVQMFRELRCRQAFAIHWGAFELADDALDAPPADLAAALQAQGVPADRFQAINTGARIDLPLPADDPAP